MSANVDNTNTVNTMPVVASSVGCNVNFDCKYKDWTTKDSLLGMASSLFDVDVFRSMLPPQASVDDAQQRQRLNQQPPARPEDITSQVLAELSDDLFLDSGDLFNSEELEPIPVNPSKMNVVGKFQPAQSSSSPASRYELFESTLSQVLNQDLGLAVPPLQQPLPVQTPTLLPGIPLRIASTYKREAPASTTSLPPMKRQRVSPSSNVVVGGNNRDVVVEDDPRRFRPYQAEQWTEKFEELCEFRKVKGHCCVPHTFKENPSLARWVKRQRYQYKLKNEGKPSTMTDERVNALEQVGFIWDSHGAAWEDRLNELRDYRAETGHCNVPSNHPSNPQLATWVKCQRRQYKLFWDGKTSNMTLGRITELEKIGFEWELRSHKSSSNNSTNRAWKL